MFHVFVFDVLKQPLVSDKSHDLVPIPLLLNKVLKNETIKDKINKQIYLENQ